MFSKLNTSTKYLFAFITLIVILALLIFWALPTMIQWHFSKDQVTKTISKTIGSNVKITGDTKVSLFPHMGITIHDVRILSPMGSYNSNLAIIPSVRIGVNFSQILRGNIYSINNIYLDRPKIYITDETQKTTSSVTNLTDTLFSISKLGFTHLQITDGTVVISNYLIKSEDVLNGINTNLDLKQDSLTGNINLNWKGLDIALNGNMYRANSKDHSIYTLVNFNLLDNALSGRIDSHISQSLFNNNNIKAHIQVNSPAKFLSQLNLSKPPKELNDPLDINMELQENKKKLWNSSKFIITSKGHMTNGSISYVPLKEQISNAQLNIKTSSKSFNMNNLITYLKGIHPEDNNPNLGKNVLNYRVSAITPISNRSALVNSARSQQQQHKMPYEISWILPKHLDINLENQADSIDLLNSHATNFVFNAKIKSNEILIKEASASFPGEASFKLFGFIHSSKGSPMLDGTILFNSNNPTETLKWIGVSNEKSSNKELNASFRTTILADSHQLQLNNLVFNMDNLNFKGSLNKNLDTTKNLTIKGDFSTIPFDDWVPYIIKTISSVDTNSIKGTFSTIFDQESFDSPTSIKLTSTDATLSGIALKDVNLDLAINDGDLEIKSFKAMPIGDGSVKVTGGISDFFTDPEFNNLKIQASLKDSANALDSDILPGYIPAKAEITIVGNVKNTNADVIFSYGTMKGSVRTGGSWQTGIMYPLVVNLSDKNAYSFFNNLGYTNFNVGNQTQELNVSAVIKKSQSSNSYKLSELDATMGDSELNGDASFDANKEIPYLALHLNASNISYDILNHMAIRPPKTANTVRDSQSPLIKLTQNLNTDILLNIKSLDINGQYVDDVNIKANTVNGILNLDNTTLQFPASDVIPPTAHVQFSWDTNTSLPTSTLTWDTKNVKIESVLPNIGIQGQITSQGKLTGYGYTVSQMFDNMNGSGKLALSQVVYGGKRDETTLAPLGSIHDVLTIVNNKQMPYTLQTPFQINTGLLKFTDGTISTPLSTGTIDGIINLTKQTIQANGSVLKGTTQDWFTLKNSLTAPSKAIDNKGL